MAALIRLRFGALYIYVYIILLAWCKTSALIEDKNCSITSEFHRNSYMDLACHCPENNPWFKYIKTIQIIVDRNYRGTRHKITLDKHGIDNPLADTEIRAKEMEPNTENGRSQLIVRFKNLTAYSEELSTYACLIKVETSDSPPAKSDVWLTLQTSSHPPTTLLTTSTWPNASFAAQSAVAQPDYAVQSPVSILMITLGIAVTVGLVTLFLLFFIKGRYINYSKKMETKLSVNAAVTPELGYNRPEKSHKCSVEVTPLAHSVLRSTNITSCKADCYRQLSERNQKKVQADIHTDNVRTLAEGHPLLSRSHMGRHNNSEQSPCLIAEEVEDDASHLQSQGFYYCNPNSPRHGPTSTCQSSPKKDQKRVPLKNHFGHQQCQKTFIAQKQNDRNGCNGRQASVFRPDVNCQGCTCVQSQELCGQFHAHHQSSNSCTFLPRNPETLMCHNYTAADNQPVHQQSVRVQGGHLIGDNVRGNQYTADQAAAENHWLHSREGSRLNHEEQQVVQVEQRDVTDIQQNQGERAEVEAHFVNCGQSIDADLPPVDHHVNCLSRECLSRVDNQTDCLNVPIYATYYQAASTANDILRTTRPKDRKLTPGLGIGATSSDRDCAVLDPFSMCSPRENNTHCWDLNSDHSDSNNELMAASQHRQSPSACTACCDGRHVEIIDIKTDNETRRKRPVSTQQIGRCCSDHIPIACASDVEQNHICQAPDDPHIPFCQRQLDFKPEVQTACQAVRGQLQDQNFGRTPNHLHHQFGVDIVNTSEPNSFLDLVQDHGTEPKTALGKH